MLLNSWKDNVQLKTVCWDFLLSIESNPSSQYNKSDEINSINIFKMWNEMIMQMVIFNIL